VTWRPSCGMGATQRWPAGWPIPRSEPAGRNHDLDSDGLAAAEHAWEEYWPATRPVELTRPVERHAGRLAAQYALRGADAVHLASALALSDPGLILAAWDRRLRAGARAAGVAVAPAELGS